MLAEALPLAAGLGIDPARVDCDADNVASRRVIERGGGVDEERDGSLYFWVPTTPLYERPPARSGSMSRCAPFDGPVRHAYVHVRSAAPSATTAISPRGRSAVGADGRAGAEAAPARRLRGRRRRRVGARADGSRRAPPPYAVSRRRHAEPAAAGAARAAARSSGRTSRRTRKSPSRPIRRTPTTTTPCGAAAAPLGGGAAAERGVRVSLGAQSFSPELRAVLGRTAQADPAEAFLRLREAGVANAGLDLIHGIPGQTPELLAADIAAVLESASRPRLLVRAGRDRGNGAGDANRGRPAGRTRRPCRPTRWTTSARPATGASSASLPRRLRLVRGQQLRPAGAAGAPQRGVLARPALPRPRPRRREHRRRPALDERRRSGRLGGGARGRRAASTRSRDARPGDPRPRALPPGCPLRPARLARRGGRRHRSGRRPQPRRRWIGFPAQWYNPRDAKGEARSRRGMRAPVLRFPHLEGGRLPLTARQTGPADRHRRVHRARRAGRVQAPQRGA